MKKEVGIKTALKYMDEEIFRKKKSIYPAKPKHALPARARQAVPYRGKLRYRQNISAIDLPTTVGEGKEGP